MDKQQIKQRAFAAYIGADVVNIESGASLEMITIFGDIVVVSEPDFPYSETSTGIGDELEWSIDQCQLSLTPLSDITDEDAIEVAKLSISQSEIKDFKVIKILREDGLVKVQFTWCNAEGLTLYWISIGNKGGLPQCMERKGSDLKQTHYQFPVQCIDYLRSKKYCIPFMGLDLVKEGWAILKTKQDAG